MGSRTSKGRRRATTGALALALAGLAHGLAAPQMVEKPALQADEAIADLGPCSNPMTSKVCSEHGSCVDQGGGDPAMRAAFLLSGQRMRSDSYVRDVQRDRPGGTAHAPH